MTATPIADMVSAMLSSGVTAETIVLAVKTAEILSAGLYRSPVDKAAENRRAYDRERRRKERESPPESGGPPGTDPEKPVHRSPVESGGMSGGQKPETYNDSLVSKNSEGKKKRKNIVGNGAVHRSPVDEDFEAFWKGYPRTPTMSKKETLTAWRKLSEADRDAILTAGPKYAAWLASERRKRPDVPAVHAVRFITQRRFEGFNEPPDPETPKAPLGEPLFKHGDHAPASAGRVAGYIYLKSETPEWDRWVSYNKSQGRRSPAQDKFGGWFFPTAAPPE